MSKRIFLAGAAGAIGRRLSPLLVEAGHQVWGTTRSAERAEDLRKLGVAAVLLDMFDAGNVGRAVAAAAPEIVIHQLTDLPSGLDPARMGEAVHRNARIRDEGTRNLIGAAVKAGATRVIAQSIAWIYAAGAEPHREEDPLDDQAEGQRAISIRGVISLERQVLDAPLDGLVLRYGHLYGPGTGADAPRGSSPIHVADAARAALVAVERGAPGVYNIAEPNAHIATDKAARELGFRAMHQETRA